MPALLRGQIGAARYAALLHNLLALYTALESALQRCRAQPGFAAFAFETLRRVPALQADLAALPPPDATLQASTQHVVQRLQQLEAHDAPGLVAHAYVRYLGDLNGGQLLRRSVGTALRLPPSALHFYDFGPPEQAAASAARFRAALDALPLDAAQARRLVDEARWSFAQHVALFEALAA